MSPERLAECSHSRDLLNELVQQATIEAGIDAWICPATGSVASVGYVTCSCERRCPFILED